MLEVRRLPDPLAPETAARVAGLPQSTLDDLVGPIRNWLASAAPPADVDPLTTSPGRVDVVEGAGGPLRYWAGSPTALAHCRRLSSRAVRPVRSTTYSPLSGLLV